MVCFFGFAVSILYYIVVVNYIGLYTYLMDSESKKLGANLKRIRIKKDISQGDIARALGVDRGFISNIENGKTNPTLATITKLAQALEVSSDQLLK